MSTLTFSYAQLIVLCIIMLFFGGLVGYAIAWTSLEAIIRRADNLVDDLQQAIAIANKAQNNGDNNRSES